MLSDPPESGRKRCCLVPEKPDGSSYIDGLMTFILAAATVKRHAEWTAHNAGGWNMADKNACCLADSSDAICYLAACL